MGEAFLLAGGVISSVEDGFQGWLENQHLRLAWLDEIHQVSAFPAPESSQTIPVFHWPVDSASAHRLLHLLIADIELDKREMVGLVITEAGGPFGMVLGSPAALGRRNLLPAARLCAFSLPNETGPDRVLDGLKSGLAACNIEPSRVFALAQWAPSSETLQQSAAVLNPAMPVKTAVRMAQTLLDLLHSAPTSGSAGLLAQSSIGLVTVVETI
ncbi:MAG: hypothetical protein ACYC3P_04730 [Bellilinea sp.]